MLDTGVVTGSASGQPSHTHRLRGLADTGLIATLAAMVAGILAAALAQAAGVDFEVPDGGQTIPLSGFAVVTGFFSVVGIVIAAALLRWSARPAERFVRTAVSLTAISLVPPLLSEANTATAIALVERHLVAATVMIPTLAREPLHPDRLTIRVREAGRWRRDPHGSSYGTRTVEHSSRHFTRRVAPQSCASKISARLRAVPSDRARISDLSANTARRQERANSTARFALSPRSPPDRRFLGGQSCCGRITRRR